MNTTWKSSFVALFSVLLLLSGCGSESTANAGPSLEELQTLTQEQEQQITELQGENEQLKTDITESTDKLTELEEELKDKKSVEDLEGKIVKLEEEKKALHEKNEAFEGEKKELIKENEELTSKISSLEEEKQTLQEEIQTKEAEHKEALSSAQNSGSTSEQTSNDTEGQASCDIKGSVNGIYHVPGSTYYAQTKNVAQHFCSVEEAEKAGYRAPKR
ncbi:sunset domain-containing protein [Alkalicoccobacillus porphyridii]|uniref:Uncharacterized protein n=1 Tax=Alkalicoccobacillus porphyridii TaxID=2597270 RepID=A0A554A3X6_9BACI|nr:hypothetical protein [Alkalicoccobacillus porphyridii]TSB48392.1 hypothetical protein FN960_02230 [Alkalicoccobacillus porphyridii]